MTTQFLSRVDRIDKNAIPLTSNSNAGPGSYDIAGTIRQPIPGFAPFTTTSKRSDLARVVNDTPAPGTYNIAASMIKPSMGAATAFKSKTQRFQEYTRQDDSPPRPTNTLEAPLVSESVKSKKKTAKASGPTSIDVLKTILPTPAPPSIPTRFQSFGYEQDENTGKLVLQKPVEVIYTGEKGDTIGPGSYNIRRDIHDGHAINFGKCSDRNGLEKEIAKSSSMPGPGYYNMYSSFDMLDDSRKFLEDKDADFVLRLKASKKRQSATFESKTGRDPLNIRAEGPGPGNYELPSSIQLASAPAPEHQTFGVTGPRFREEVPRSLRLNTAPGQYNPITSDFEKDKIKILKQKKMMSRSGWAQNIAFTSTETRFHVMEKIEGPAPGAYTPKDTLADNIPRQKIRAGPFGSTSDRFNDNKIVHPPRREDIAAMELEREMNAGREQPRRGPKHQRPHHSSVFASKEDRFPREKEPEGPPPSAYYTTPTWESGTVRMAPPSTHPSQQMMKKKEEGEAPGPGAYNLPNSIQVKKGNRKSVLFSSAPRETITTKNAEAMPGPGWYNLRGSLTKPSHNVYLSAAF